MIVNRFLIDFFNDCKKIFDIYIYLSGFVKTWLKKCQVHFNYLTCHTVGRPASGLGQSSPTILLSPISFDS